ncbi:MAG: hypothetical protein CMC51_01880 [Flavobacteriaceae bacterium]|jgi:hypothetical protein|nr:hypothetical protein [Flavobacteriaceae bacterium]|tara:strand:+ start:15513 stop:15818 length:306 start_codon:yes stop_codon:yes gene_type:complete
MDYRLKKKKIFSGLLIGIIANLFGIFLTIIILFQEFNLINIINIFNDAITNKYLTKLISLGAVINLIVFLLLLKYNYIERARGVLMATFIIAILTIYLNNF